MKIISFAAVKGGVGKTTICYNWGEFLSVKKHKKILFIDMDSQCSLTQTFDQYNSNNNIGNIFRKETVTPIKINNYVSIVSGSPSLDILEASVESRTDKNMLLYLWMMKNSDLLENFDYILIDCHPDFGTATKNAIVVSHAIISPLTPNQYSYDSRENIEMRLKNLKDEAIDYKTGESYVTANLLFVLNMIKNNTNSSRRLVEQTKDDKKIIAKIPQRELFNRSTFINDMGAIPLVRMENDPKILQKNRQFFIDINEIFCQLQSIIDKI